MNILQYIYQSISYSISIITISQIGKNPPETHGFQDGGVSGHGVSERASEMIQRAEAAMARVASKGGTGWGFDMTKPVDFTWNIWL